MFAGTTGTATNNCSGYAKNREPAVFRGLYWNNCSGYNLTGKAADSGYNNPNNFSGCHPGRGLPRQKSPKSGAPR